MTISTSFPSEIAEARLSQYGQSCAVPSPVSQLMQEFSRGFRAGIDINLGVGYVNEETIPARAIAEAFAFVAEHPSEYPHAFNYGESKGSRRLDGALRRFFVRHHIGDYTEETLSKREFAIGANGATILLYSFAQVMPRGVVLTTDPQYYIYANALRRLGFQLRTVPEDDDGIDVDAFETLVAQCSDEISFVYVVTIGNPSAAVLSNQRRKRLVEAVTRLSRRLGRKIPLLLDEAYEWLLHSPELAGAHSGNAGSNGSTMALRSGTQWDELGLVYELGTLSKVLAPSLRIGFVLGPKGTLLDSLVQSTNDMGFSAPLLNQEACAYLLDTLVDDHLRAVRDGYRAKATLVKQALERHLGAWLEHCVGGRAGFYYYLTFKGLETHSRSPLYAFCSRTTGEANAEQSARVVYLPGDLCVDQSGPSAERSRRQMRLSFGFSSDAELARGIEVLGDAARYAKDELEGISATVLATPPLQAFLQHLLLSYERCTGTPLVSGIAFADKVREMARAPFVVLSHDAQAEPVYNFGNALALQLWEMQWNEFTSMQSNRCAEPMHREQRERFLQEVRERGFARGYSGVRISKTGRRFRIEDVTCWNIYDERGERIGQAATYPRWVFLPQDEAPHATP